MNSGKHGLIVSKSPQFFDRTSTASIMWTVVFCLSPAALWGVYEYGAQALAVLLTSTAAAVITEWIIGRAMQRSTGARRGDSRDHAQRDGTKRDRDSRDRDSTGHQPGILGSGSARSSLSDGSAVLSGLLIGLTMPPAVPLYIPAVAGIVAMAVVKWSFGGLGNNWMNPALAARAFVQFSWPQQMSSWRLPRALLAGGGNVPDAVSGATPLGLVHQQPLAAKVAAGGPLELLKSVGYPRTNLDVSVTQWLNSHLLGHLGVSLPAGYIDLFVGNTSGAIGESSALLLLIGSIFMFGRRIISWQIPLSFFLSFALLEWIAGGLQYGGALFGGDVLFEVLGGGFLLVIFFMATDTVTSPMTGTGMLIFGAGAGIVAFVIRAFGALPEGAGMAVIFMNMFVPLINRGTLPARYGAAIGRERRVT